MASRSYKTYERLKRTIDIQATFTKGMKFTNGAVDEGFMKMLVNYDLSNDGTSLIPRPGLRVSNIIAPDWSSNLASQVLGNGKRIIDCKECVEKNGHTYRQFILGTPRQNDQLLTDITVVTSDKSLDEEQKVDYIEADGYRESDITLSSTLISPSYIAKSKTYKLDDLHGIKMESDGVFNVIGTFGFENGYYWFADDNKLYKSEFETDRYLRKAVDVKDVTPTDAVSFGYNMLSSTPYTFTDGAKSGKIELTGILPYATGTNFGTLQMTPKQNETLDFRCYFNAQVGKQYKFVWEWRTVQDSEYTQIQDLKTAPTYTVVSDGTGKVKLKDPNNNDVILYQSFKAPSKEIMVRVQAFDVTNTDYVEEAMTMGFDFTPETYGNTKNVKQEQYDLSTASGMVYWQNRIVLYGVQKDPTILFISDLNEPGYFPYPNNITIFNDPIIAVKVYMGKLLVFTTSEIYQVELNADGISFRDTVIQTNLYLEPGDISFIQIVRNMVFFKSGNYFYMVVPKAQSSTGVLTLAPISSNIVELFNKFEQNLYLFLMEVYDYDDTVRLYDYYNFLDYDDVHNIYVFKYVNERLVTEGYLYFDLIYDTNLRSWRTYIFEATDYLKPYRFDATQRGILAGLTSLKSDDKDLTYIEFFKWDIINVSDFRLFPNNDFIFPSASSNTWTAAQKEALNILFEDSYLNSKEKKTFFNWQYLDTGYRNNELEYLKRYREIQIQLNNVDGMDLEFGMDFYLDNEVRMRWYDYEIEHIIDESSPNYGMLYVTRVTEPNISIGRNTTMLAGNVDERWQGDPKKVWKLGQSQFPDLSLWKLRMPVSGKGAAPRLRFVSQNDCRYELMTINWVCRVMNAR